MSKNRGNEWWAPWYEWWLRSFRRPCAPPASVLGGVCFVARGGVRWCSEALDDICTAGDSSDSRPAWRA